MLSRIPVGVVLIGLLGIWPIIVFALPEEKDPLRPRVPLEKRSHYRTLQSPLYRHSSNVPVNVVESGQAVYQRICENCHGKSGKGNGHSAGFLPVRPRNFTNCIFQKKRTDGELFYTIKFGSWPMPPMIPTISEEDAWSVLAYIRTFCPK